MNKFGDFYKNPRTGERQALRHQLELMWTSLICGFVTQLKPHKFVFFSSACCHITKRHGNKISQQLYYLLLANLRFGAR